MTLLAIMLVEKMTFLTNMTYLVNKVLYILLDKCTMEITDCVGHKEGIKIDGLNSQSDLQ